MKTSTYFALINRYNNVCTGIYEYILPYIHSYFDIQVHLSMYEYICVTTARLEAVWKRLSDRFASVVADTSMITLTTAYAAHFHDIYIDSKENAKMTGDSMKMLMLTLPFMVRDLIAPEVHSSL